MSRQRNQRPHLGVGWNFPIRPQQGTLRYAVEEASVEQAIGIVLETARRERVMRPGFGSGLRKRVFAPNTPPTHRRLEEEIRASLIRGEPRIRVEQVSAAASREQQNTILIQIDYVVKRTNARANRVFPFYLNEGQ